MSGFGWSNRNRIHLAFMAYKIPAMKPNFRYDRSLFLLLGLALSLATTLTAFRWASPANTALPPEVGGDNQEVEVIDIPTTVQNRAQQKALPKPIIVNTVATDPSPEPSPDPEPVLEPTPEPSGQGTGAVVLPPDDELDADEPFITVEDMPEYPGGEAALFRDLGNAFRYPALERDMGIQGVVYVSFVVNREGQVEQVKILRGLSEGLDAAVIKAVKAMKRWSPGKQRGRAVPVIYTLPFNIQLR